MLRFSTKTTGKKEFLYRHCGSSLFLVLIPNLNSGELLQKSKSRRAKLLRGWVAIAARMGSVDNLLLEDWVLLLVFIAPIVSIAAAYEDYLPLIKSITKTYLQPRLPVSFQPTDGEPRKKTKRKSINGLARQASRSYLAGTPTADRRRDRPSNENLGV